MKMASGRLFRRSSTSIGPTSPLSTLFRALTVAQHSGPYRQGVHIVESLVEISNGQDPSVVRYWRSPRLLVGQSLLHSKVLLQEAQQIRQVFGLQLPSSLPSGSSSNLIPLEWRFLFPHRQGSVRPVGSSLREWSASSGTTRRDGLSKNRRALGSSSEAATTSTPPPVISTSDLTSPRMVACSSTFETVAFDNFHPP
ncbi:hypothetical protein FALCPG4_015862 [Fusarium falciforme]